MSEGIVAFSVKELFQRIETKLDRVEAKLDTELSDLGHRITAIETRNEGVKYLISEHADLMEDVEALRHFRARFLPMSVVVALLAFIALGLDLWTRL